MKRWNRKNELLADAAERASVAARWLGGAPYPSEKLYNAWDLRARLADARHAARHQPPKAYEYCWNDELLAQNQFAAVEQDARRPRSSALDTRRRRAVPLVVYNPLSIAREDVVEATVRCPRARRDRPGDRPGWARSARADQRPRGHLRFMSCFRRACRRVGFRGLSTASRAVADAALSREASPLERERGSTWKTRVSG